MRRGVLVALCLVVSPVILADAGLGGWEPLGPGTTGAIVRAIWIDPVDTDRIVIGSPGGGIWRTINGGASWGFASQGAPSQVVSCLAGSPAAPEILYAGTGESFALFRGAPGAGLLKSTDGGGTWLPLESTASWVNDDNRYVNSIAVDPTDADILLVATDAGIQRSTDGGQSWDDPLPRTGRVTEVRFVGDAGHAVAGLESNGREREADPPPSATQDLECALYSDDGVEWHTATFQGIPGSANLSEPAGVGDTVICVDLGSDFQYLDYLRLGTPANNNEEVVQLLEVEPQSCAGGGDRLKLRVVTTSPGGPPVPNNGPITKPHFSGEPVTLKISQRVALAVNPDSLRVYASMGAGGGTVWASADLGQTYSFTSNPNAEDEDSNSDYLKNRAYYNNAIWAATNPQGTNDIVIVAGAEAHLSLNGGVNFQRISNRGQFGLGKSAHADHHAIVPHPFYPNVRSVYFGNDGGIQRADDILLVEPESGWTNLACLDGYTVGDCPSEVACDCCAGGDGCNCGVCATLVCAADSLCCSGAWSAACDAWASTLCSCCPGQNPGVCPASGLGLGQFWCGATTADGEWLLGGGQDVDTVVREPSASFNDWVLSGTAYPGLGDARGCAIREDNLGGVDLYTVSGNQVWKINQCEVGTPSAPAACVRDSDCPDHPTACSDGVCNCEAENQSEGCACESGAIPPPPEGCRDPPSCNFFDTDLNPGNDVFKWAITTDPNASNILVAGGRSLWWTLSEGADWHQISDPLASGSISTTVAIATGDSANIWAGYEDGSLIYTKNFGADWHDAALPAVNAPCVEENACSIGDILIDPNDASRVYVALAGYGYDFRNSCCEQTLLMKDMDDGSDWVPLMGTAPHNLPSTAAFSIAMHPEDPDWLYLGTDRGIYASDDGGATWGRTPSSDRNEGPHDIIVTDLSWHDPDYLVATTYGLGMHRARSPRTVYVDGSWSGEEQGTEPKPFDTVQEAVNLAGPGATISIAGGSYDEDGISFATRGRVVATGGNATID